ncbi:MAG: hypothetical protein K6C94_04425 [Candidatus Gastranaerophilales bacterium]|nr:hypothetical protein [Candidatus Gastranaerophilales bacterium]
MSNLKKISAYLFLFFGSFVLLYLLSLLMLNPAIDTGRELYIPFRMLNGEVLYKDIFNIYGPLAYQINAFSYCLMGARINSLRIFGIFNFMLILSSIWFILKEFFEKDDKITVFSKFTKGFKDCMLVFILLSLYSLGIFNYILPYSFAMTYGLCFFLWSLFCLIEFSKTDLPKFAYLSCLFAGGAVCCKYEFFAYLIFLLLYLLFCKKPKTFLISVLSLAIIPVISFGTLFLQGMSFADLSKTFQIMKTMADTVAIKYLYTNFTGTYFNLKVFGICFGKTLVLAVIGAILYFFGRLCRKDKFLTLIVYTFSFLGMIYTGTVGFSLFAIINTLLLIIYFKKIYANKPVFIFMSASILLSLKTFFAVNIETYGAYTLPLLIISIFVFLSNIDYCEDNEVKSNILNTYSVIVFFFVLIFVINSTIINLKKLHGFITTEPILTSNHIEQITKTEYTYPYIAEPINMAIAYISNNTKTTDKIVVLPETQFLNFVTKRPADNLYDSLTPLYFETFGEDNIIEHFKETKPEYFILNNRNTIDYGKRYICEDYGQNFCSFVDKNYKKVETFGEKQYILQVFKRKDLL